MTYTHEQVKQLLKEQRDNCRKAYTDYYAGSEEDFAPDCIVNDIANAPEPVNFIPNHMLADSSCCDCYEPDNTTAMNCKNCKQPKWIHTVIYLR